MSMRIEGRRQFPVYLPPMGPRTQQEVVFGEPKVSCEPLPVNEWSRNKWILETMWALIDHRAQLAGS